mgnify:CR=1 FL=1
MKVSVSACMTFPLSSDLYNQVLEQEVASKLAEGRSPVDTWIILHKSLRNKTMDTETRCIVPSTALMRYVSLPCYCQDYSWGCYTKSGYCCSTVRGPGPSIHGLVSENSVFDTETRCIVPLCFVRKLQYPELDIGPGPSAIRSLKAWL